MSTALRRRRAPPPASLPRAQIDVEVGDQITGTVKIARQKLNHRLLWVQVMLSHERAGAQIGDERTLNYRLD